MMVDPPTSGIPFDLIRGVRHDANNALTSALGNVQLARADPALQNEHAQDALGRIEVELKRLAEIIRRLNDLSDITPRGPP
jgi:signal transduction histidine kinase